MLNFLSTTYFNPLATGTINAPSSLTDFYHWPSPTILATHSAFSSGFSFFPNVIAGVSESLDISPPPFFLINNDFMV